MFIMLSGSQPFYHEERFELYELIKNGAYNFNASVWQQISNEGKELVCNLLTVDPDQRITAEELKAHRWTTGDFKKQENSINVV